MTLQALIAELLTLSIAHPDETPIYVQVAGNTDPLITVSTESDEDLRVVLNG